MTHSIISFASRLAMAVVVAAAQLAVVNQAAANVVVYEGFADYSAGYLVGQAVGDNTIGLNKTTTWISNNEVQWTVVPTDGLTLGSGATALTTSPGAVYHPSGSSVAAAKLDLDNYVGTLYASYLVNININPLGVENPSLPNGVVFTVIGEGALANSNRRFRSLARNATASDSPVGVHYSSSAMAGIGEVNVTETTFMILSRFTRVGMTIDADTPGVASLWALDSAQFDHFKANGFVGLDSVSIGSGSNEVTGRARNVFVNASALNFDLNSDTTPNLHLQLASAIGSMPAPNAGVPRAYTTFDEIRMGSSFDAVTPVVGPPPPSADFNEDGFVDGTDLGIWSDGFGQSGTLESGDANSDGLVDGTDFLIWQRTVTGPAAAAVPEPSSGFVAGAAMLATLGWKRRRRGHAK